MKATNKEPGIIKNALLQNVVETAKDNGFKVYGFQWGYSEITQIFISNERGVCTVSADLGGLNLSSCHIPNKDFGTGFRLNESPLFEIPVEALKNAITIVKPCWANGETPIIKFKNWSEYLEKESILKYFEI